MIKENKVSLWLGTFNSSDDFNEYCELKFDEDGNYIKSQFQNEFNILKYDLDAFEKDWISDSCSNVESLLVGFSYDNVIIPKFDKLINHEKIKDYNSILLLFNFEYDGEHVNSRMEYVGCVDVDII